MKALLFLGSTLWSLSIQNTFAFVAPTRKSSGSSNNQCSRFEWPILVGMTEQASEGMTGGPEEVVPESLDLELAENQDNDEKKQDAIDDEDSPPEEVSDDDDEEEEGPQAAVVVNVETIDDDEEEVIAIEKEVTEETTPVETTAIEAVVEKEEEKIVEEEVIAVEKEVTAETTPVETTAIEAIAEKEEEEKIVAIAPTDQQIKKKGSSSWFELLGAAAEVAGAIGGAAVKVASVAIEDMVPKEVVDVSIPYDSACFLAYTQWLCKYKKEDPDLDRYEYFSKTYKKVTIANVITKKKMRERSLSETEDEEAMEDLPKLLSLDQYADLSDEEYAEVMKSLEPKTWSGLLGELATLSINMATGATKSSQNEVSIKKEVPAPKAVAAPKETKPFSFLAAQIALKKSDKSPVDETKKPPVVAKKEEDSVEPNKPFPFVTMQDLVKKPDDKLFSNVGTDKTPISVKDEKPSVTNHAFSFLTTQLTMNKADEKSDTNGSKKTLAASKKKSPTAESKPFSFLSATPTLNSKKKKPEANDVANGTKKTPPVSKEKQPHTAFAWFSPPTIKSKVAPAPQVSKSTLNIMPVNKKKAETKPQKKTSGGWKGASTSFVKKKATPKKSPISSARNTISIVKAKDIPALSKWKVNKDGSITGYISNSENFRTGTKITTSPVPQGSAKAGSVVVTGSGSKYRLKP